MTSADRLLLAWDTSTPTAYVALCDGSGAVRAEASAVAARHSAHLLTLVDRVLRAAGVGLAQISALACGRGPGSFTGLRVGLAVAKGLALPADRPLVLVSSLEALALDLATAGDPAAAARDTLAVDPGAAGGRELLVPCLDAGKGQLYAAVCAVRGRSADASSPDGLASTVAVPLVEALTPEWLLDPEELARVLAAQFPTATVGGAGAERHRAALADRPYRQATGPSAAAVARLATARLDRGERDDLATAAPAYGRPPDITRPRPRAGPDAVPPPAGRKRRRRE